MEFEFNSSAFTSPLALLKCKFSSAQLMITVQNPPLNFGANARGYACVLLQGERGVIIS